MINEGFDAKVRVISIHTWVRISLYVALLAMTSRSMGTQYQPMCPWTENKRECVVEGD